MLHFIVRLKHNYGLDKYRCYDYTNKKIVDLTASQIKNIINNGEIIRNIAISNNSIVGFIDKNNDVELQTEFITDSGYEEYNKFKEKIIPISEGALKKRYTAIYNQDNYVELVNMFGNRTSRVLYGYSDGVWNCKTYTKGAEQQITFGVYPWDNVKDINSNISKLNSKLDMLETGYRLSSTGVVNVIDREAITSVSIKSCCKTILPTTFYGCNNLKKVVVGGSVKSISTRAFISCKSIEYIKFEEGLENIGESAFEGCGYINSIILPNSIKKISARAFGATQIGKMLIPDSIQSIHGSSFISGNGLMRIMTTRRVANMIMNNVNKYKDAKRYANKRDGNINESNFIIIDK